MPATDWVPACGPFWALRARYNAMRVDPGAEAVVGLPDVVQKGERGKARASDRVEVTAPANFANLPAIVGCASKTSKMAATSSE